MFWLCEVSSTVESEVEESVMHFQGFVVAAVRA